MAGLAEWLRLNWAVKLSVRQCQRLFRQLGFRQRKPRPVIAHADPLLQETHKKNSENWPPKQTWTSGSSMRFTYQYARGNCNAY
jgi:hypothetical protein